MFTDYYNIPARKHAFVDTHKILIKTRHLRSRQAFYIDRNYLQFIVELIIPPGRFSKPNIRKLL